MADIGIWLNFIRRRVKKDRGWKQKAACHSTSFFTIDIIRSISYGFM